MHVEPFWIGKYPVTWAEYGQFMKLADLFHGFEGMTPPLRPVTKDQQSDAVTAPSNLYDPTFTFRNGQKPRQPAVTMSQYAAKQYTKWLSRLSDDFYRPPQRGRMGIRLRTRARGRPISSVTIRPSLAAMPGSSTTRMNRHTKSAASFPILGACTT